MGSGAHLVYKSWPSFTMATHRWQPERQHSRQLHIWFGKAGQKICILHDKTCGRKKVCLKFQNMHKGKKYFRFSRFSIISRGVILSSSENRFPFYWLSIKGPLKHLWIQRKLFFSSVWRYVQISPTLNM